MRKCHVRTYQVNNLSSNTLDTKGCFKVKVRNESTGPVVVEDLPIYPGQDETFDLPAEHVFNRDFTVNMEDAVKPALYVTRFFYDELGDHCTPIPSNC